MSPKAVMLLPVAAIVIILINAARTGRLVYGRWLPANLRVSVGRLERPVFFWLLASLFGALAVALLAVVLVA
jgi:hypothetical protein